MSRRSGKSRTRIRAYGEMVDLLWREGNVAAALRMEELWNQLAHTHPFSLLCAYNMGTFQVRTGGDPFDRLCRLHTHVIPSEDVLRGEPEGAEDDHDLATLEHELRDLEELLSDETEQR